MRLLFIFVFSAIISIGQSQQIKSVTDSLIGFDINLVINEAPYRGIEPTEMPLYIEYCKRGFINDKYNIKVKDLTHDLYKELSTFATSYCLNEDFENSVATSTASVPKVDTIKTSGGISGWTAFSGINTGTAGSCILPPNCCTVTPNAVYVIGHDTAGYTDALIGSVYKIYSVFGDSINKGNLFNSFTCKGKYFTKLNNSSAGSSINRIVKTFTVMPSNSLFTFASMAVSNGGGHCCCDNNGVSVKFKDCSGNLLPTPQFSIAPSQQSSSLCPGYIPCTSMTSTVTFSSIPATSYVRTKWNVAAVNLTPYIGTCITIEANAFDCPYAGHMGYGYFDSQCDSMYILANSLRLGAISDTIIVNSCATYTDTLMAPNGLGPYIWTGPPGFITANTQSVITNIPGTYTLSMNGFGSYAPTYKYIILSHAIASLSVTSANTILCQGDSTILNSVGATSYTWSTGAITNSIVVTPSITTTYTVNGINVKGCPAKGVYTQSVSLCTGVNATTEYLSHFNIQPNPNNGEFIITQKTSSKDLTAKIYNALGQLVFEKQLIENKTYINISEQSNGVYFIKLFSDFKLLFATKIIKTGN